MKTINIATSQLSPSKIICIGRNYVEHIQELDNDIPSEPVIFLKPNSAISEQLIAGKEETHHYEGEICFLIKNNQLYGVGLGLDITKRQLQSRLKEKGLPWERAKAFDGSAVFSDFICLDVAVESLRMMLYRNDALKQHANYTLMMNKPNDLLQEIQQFMSTEDGDIIMTGTPKGVGEYHQGDTFTMHLYSADNLLLSQTWQAV
ncbi:MAG: FAA hydrolase family protein [Aquificaceae bacterium]|nr:MAG: FAA hydrolase family protein [Aquificaceae bacterium]